VQPVVVEVHVPSTQVAVSSHGASHSPQCAGSLRVSTHVAPHRDAGAAQALASGTCPASSLAASAASSAAPSITSASGRMLGRSPHATSRTSTNAKGDEQRISRGTLRAIDARFHGQFGSRSTPSQKERASQPGPFECAGWVILPPRGAFPESHHEVGDARRARAATPPTRRRGVRPPSCGDARRSEHSVHLHECASDRNQRRRSRDACPRGALSRQLLGPTWRGRAIRGASGCDAYGCVSPGTARALSVTCRPRSKSCVCSA
jgi:hypothetical protein